MRTHDFDRVAFVYDTLARIVFGDKIKRAQSHFLHRIPTNATVLVLGSGTGWIANEILHAQPDAQVTLVDTSSQMTAKARRLLRGKPVTILCADEGYLFSKPFDVLILPFFLDVFSTQKLEAVLSKISRNTHGDTLWLVTDFVNKKGWHKLYLWAMYRFFRITCALEATALPNWDEVLSRNLKLRAEEKFYGDFIITKVFTP